MAAHVLADLAFQAATREYPSDAIALGQAAVRTAAVSPAGVRASVQTRLAYGHALAGQLDDFDRAYAIGLDTIAGRELDEEPAWMYYLTPNHLDTQAGYALRRMDVMHAHAADRASPARSCADERAFEPMHEHAVSCTTIAQEDAG